MTTIDIDPLAARYTSLQTEPDPSVRRQAIEDLWAKEGPELTTTETVAHGSTHGDVGPRGSDAGK